MEQFKRENILNIENTTQGYIYKHQILVCALLFSVTFHPANNSKQQLKHSKQARAAQTCVRRIAHWLFMCEQVLMKHMQQTRSSTWLQQLEAALTKSSVGSAGFTSSLAGALFSTVAFKLPNPTPRFPRTMTFWRFDSVLFSWVNLLQTCLEVGTM